ncbi:MAG: peptidoglycan-binding protein [Bryobacterales bacterium]|nr:peptidoglycan-binding protein [Bryobacterales bacterium]
MAYKETRFPNGKLNYFYNVSTSVGPHRPNRRTDVALVQTLLRYCYKDGDVANLKIDGHCGPKTRAAIRFFQREFSYHALKAGMQALEKDGIVTVADNLGFEGPNDKPVAYTIVALNFTLFRLKPDFWQNIPTSPQVPAYLRVELLKPKP